jgi:hypothetical protein
MSEGNGHHGHFAWSAVKKQYVTTRKLLALVTNPGMDFFYGIF